MKDVQIINESFFDDIDTETIQSTSEELPSIDEYSFGCTIVFDKPETSDMGKTVADNINMFFGYANVPVFDVEYHYNGMTPLIVTFGFNYKFLNIKTTYRFMQILRRVVDLRKLGITSDITVFIKDTETNKDIDILYRLLNDDEVIIANQIRAVADLCEYFGHTDRIRFNDIIDTLGLYSNTLDKLQDVVHNLNEAFTKELLKKYNIVLRDEQSASLLGLYKITTDYHKDKDIDVWCCMNMTQGAMSYMGPKKLLKDCFKDVPAYKSSHHSLSSVLNDESVKVYGKDVVTFKNDSIIIICLLHSIVNYGLQSDIVVFASQSGKDIIKQVLKKI